MYNVQMYKNTESSEKGNHRHRFICRCRCSIQPPWEPLFRFWPFCKNVLNMKRLLRTSFVRQNKISNLLLYLLYYAKACNEFVGAHLRIIASAGSTSLFDENIAAVANRWQCCFRIGRPKI